MRMTSRIILTALCLLFAGAARAELSDVTGESYSWVAYNNLAAVCPYVGSPSAPANTTFWTFCGDHGAAVEPTSGELVRYADGTGTGVTVTVTKEADNQLFVDTAGSNDPGDVFSDVYGATVEGTVINHNLGAQQLLTFSGLDPDRIYTFAGVATARSQYHTALSSVEIQSVESATNESVLTVDTALGTFPGFGTTPTSTFLSYLDDDLVLWSDIAPGADGVFSVLVTSVKLGSREWAPALDAIALAASGSQPLRGDFDNDGDVDDADVDLLRDNLGDGQYDLDGDGDADGDDLAYMVENLLEWYRENPGAGEGTALGDLNRDGHVNGDDLTLMKLGYGGGWADGNLNTDSLVNGTDLAILKVNMGFSTPGRSGPTEPATDVPEPMTLTILLVGAGVILKRRR